MLETSILTKEGNIRAKFLSVDEKRALVLRGRGRGSFKSGTVFIRNREMKKRFGVEYAAYPDLYRAYERCVYIERNSGIKPAQIGGEVQQIQEWIEQVRTYVRSQLSSKEIPEAMRSAYEELQEELIRILDTKIDAYKVEAQARFRRGLVKVDSLGRRNIPAAMFVSGSGIGELLKRVIAIRRLLGYVVGTGDCLYALIQDHMDAYRTLRGLLSPFVRPKGLLITLLDPKSGPGAMKRTMEILNEQNVLFGRMLDEPFRTNAQLTAKDLQQAVRLAFDIEKYRRRCPMNRDEEDNLKSLLAIRRGQLENQYTKIRQGIAWVFARFRLEIEVITPLRLLIEDIRRAERKRREETGERGPITISRALAPAQFDATHNALLGFNERILRSNEELLEHPVKEVVQEHVDMALACMKDDEWREAIHELREAADCM